ncbi:MAG: TrmH family RNA methyltransferase [Thermomicrobiales bacterium]
MKFGRSLRRRSVREAERAFIVEGMRAVEDAVQTGAVPRYVFLRDGDSAAASVIRRHQIVAGVHVVDSKLFDGLSDTLSPQGVLAVFGMPALNVEQPAAPLVLVLDRLRDPGNMGTLLRTAAAAGVTLVTLTSETVDPYNPKVVRAAMGAHFRVPIQAWNDNLQRIVLQACPVRLVADASAPTVYDTVDWLGGTALIIGSEAHGVSFEITALATDRVSIPRSAMVESLNAAVAGGVLLFEAARQRRRHVSTFD